MSKEQLERAEVEASVAEMNLRVAEQLYDGTLDRAESVLRARTAFTFATDRLHSQRILFGISVLSSLADFVERRATYREEFHLVRQASARFLSTQQWESGDGWKWPVQIMESGWAHGSVIDAATGSEQSTPHYFPPNIVAKVAQSANGARFRKRHPDLDGGASEPELTSGWMSDCTMRGSAAVGTVNLLRSDNEVRPLLLAAREAGKLDLFAVSIEGFFVFKRSEVEGRPALVASDIQQLCGVDLCTEPGAGGRFLS